MERWLDIVGYEGYYQVSDLGRVRSINRIIETSVGKQRYKGRVLKQNSNPRGVLYVKLSRNSTRRDYLVHRLVLTAFVGNCPENMEGCHENGNPSDNRLGNLRWDTHSANHLDKRQHGTHGGTAVRRGDGVCFTTMRQAAEVTNCSQSSISRVCSGKRKRAGGYIWEYAS